ncbi:MAG TPA: hypothetical protein VLW50_25000 [Streptosporangiaceae bacterium]|nr:hypothetical protein [Streptosporangiaceae bacterium]
MTDANGIRLRLRALVALGHSGARIAGALQVPPHVVQRILTGQTKVITPEFRARAVFLYESWWDLRAPESTLHQRRAATRARSRAARNDWCCPAGLDDDLVDEPGYQPDEHWRYATCAGRTADQLSFGGVA